MKKLYLLMILCFIFNLFSYDDQLKRTYLCINDQWKEKQCFLLQKDQKLEKNIDKQKNSEKNIDSIAYSDDEILPLLKKESEKESINFFVQKRCKSMRKKSDEKDDDLTFLLNYEKKHKTNLKF